jgi:tetratricopeptide (TPR) repeat protein
MAQLDAHASLASQTVAPYTEKVLDAPDRADPYFDRAEVFYRLGDLTAARDDLDAGLERNPSVARALYARGQLRMRLGDLAGAGDDLRKSMSLARIAFEPAVRAALGDLAAVAGDLTGAIAEYGRFIDLDRTNAEVFLKRANARLRLGYLAPAANDFARAAALDPGSAEIQVGLAVASAERGDYAEALAAARSAIALDANLPDGHIRLAQVLLTSANGAQPDVPQAVLHARKAVALTRGMDPEATAILERALTLAEAAGSASV